jgi:hypothetical protein
MNQTRLEQERRNLINEVNREIISITPESYHKMRKKLEKDMQRIEREYKETGIDYEEDPRSQSLPKYTKTKYGSFGLLPPFGI